MNTLSQIRSLRHPLFFVPSSIGLAILAYAYVAWDRRVAWYFFHQTDPRIEEVAGWISELGTFIRPELAFVVGIVAFKRWPRLSQIALFFVVATLAAGLLNLAFKAGFGRSRPELLFEEAAYGFRWWQTEAKYWSFPSGHTAAAMGGMTALMLVFPRVAPIFLLQVVLIGISRVALMEHYVSDVIAGCIVGSGAALIAYDLYFRTALSRAGRERQPRTETSPPEAPL
jgi:membrane-associated phospholipid phosphatase